MPIKLKRSYQTSDSCCYATYEEAQKAELEALFLENGKSCTPTDVWTLQAISALLLEHSAEVRELLKPAIGRPVGSKSKVRKSKTPEPPANETGDP